MHPSEESGPGLVTIESVQAQENNIIAVKSRYIANIADLAQPINRGSSIDTRPFPRAENELLCWSINLFSIENEAKVKSLLVLQLGGREGGVPCSYSYSTKSIPLSTGAS